MAKEPGVHKLSNPIRVSKIAGLSGVQSAETDLMISGVAALSHATRGTLTYCNRGGEEGHGLIEKTEASAILCLPEFSGLRVEQKVLIPVNNPRLAFLRALRELFQEKVSGEVHKSAVIHSKAKIGRNVRIGPGCYVGEAEIGDGTWLQGNNYVYDRVRIGKNCFIKAGAVIGGDGLGYEQTDLGEWEKFPHLGGVTIEDDVQIGANSCIAYGTLTDTFIRRGAKLDDLVFVAHNCDIGEDTLVVACSEISGSVKIGKSTWIAPGVTILDGVKVGDDAFLGIGTIITSDVPSSHRVTPTIANKVKEKRR
jgi:UDP-3-O-[3-hydroxymyristoyl] glucosamine N-acyltransferase